MGIDSEERYPFVHCIQYYDIPMDNNMIFNAYNMKLIVVAELVVGADDVVVVVVVGDTVGGNVHSSPSQVQP